MSLSTIREGFAALYREFPQRAAQATNALANIESSLVDLARLGHVYHLVSADALDKFQAELAELRRERDAALDAVAKALAQVEAKA